MKKKIGILREAFPVPLTLPRETLEKLEKTSELLRQFWNLCIAEFYRRMEWNKNLRAYNIMLILARPEGAPFKIERMKSISYKPMIYWFTPFCTHTSVVGSAGESIPLTQISVDLRREVLRDIADSFASWFEALKRGDTETRPPRESDGGQFQTLTWSGITKLEIKNGEITLPLGARERVTIPVRTPRPFGQEAKKSSGFLEEMIGDRTIIQIIISRHKDEQLWLSAVTDKGEVPTIRQTGIIRAIDLGVGDIAVADSDGKKFLIPMRRPEKAICAGGEKVSQAIERLESEMKNGVDGSKHQKLRLKRFRRLHAQAANTRDTFQRRLAHVLVESKVRTIVVGYTPIRLGLAQSADGSAKQHKGVQNTGNMSRLMQYIQRKCKERGVEVIIVPDPARQGSLTQSMSKLRAAELMLRQELGKRGVKSQPSFVKRGFAFSQ